MSKFRVVTMVVLALALGLSVLAMGCGSSDASAAAEDFVRASAEMDCEKIVNMMSSESLQLFGEDKEKAIEGCEQNLEMLPEEDRDIEVVSFEVIEENVDGDTATVEFKVTAKISGEEETDEDTLTLVKEDGEWKVSVI